MKVIRRTKVDRADAPVLRPDAEAVGVIARQRRREVGWRDSLRSEIESEFRALGGRVFREERR